MQIDIENKVVKTENETVEIPEAVIDLLQDKSDLNDSHLVEANQFLKRLDVKRIGFNGLRLNNCYEFIFKVDGDKFLDSHSGGYEVSTNIDNVKVRIGSPSDFAILVIGCKNPFMKSYYIDNDMYHYISISFSCKETKASAIFQYSKVLINKILSKGNSFIMPDDVFKPDDTTDEWEDDFGFDQPSLNDLVDDLMGLEGTEHKSKNRSKLFSLVAEAYRFKEDARFISYFKVLEYLGRRHQAQNGESKISKYLCNMDEEFKAQVMQKVGDGLEYDKVVECMRILRNMIVHPTVKFPSNTTIYPMKKIVCFQKILISELIGFDL
ncbi:hypothetical protein [Pseudoalteromonas sp. MER144-MNA-CIBAN-0113]|uniref:hypothetical protein n=1 Tax=Pseudoalteromonas sp. MER144-MNA-CIBAN-0113 TaxID=3140429 RepID=UPI00332DA929